MTSKFGSLEADISAWRPLVPHEVGVYLQPIIDIIFFDQVIASWRPVFLAVVPYQQTSSIRNPHNQS